MSPNLHVFVVLAVLAATQPTQAAEELADKLNTTASKLEEFKNSSETILNGSWSEWGAWSTCSLTCDSGVTTRFRRCDSPAPSSSSTDCTGDPMEVDSCHVTLCPEPLVNGGWSQWGAWSPCSQTCGSGVAIRFRRCDRPAPSSTGTDCTGGLMDSDPCYVSRCQEIQSAFTAKYASTSDDILKFDIVVTNIGDDYSSSTGRFTCQYPGLYFFAVHITNADAVNDHIFVYINVNGVPKVYAGTNPQDDNNIGSYETSVTLVTRLSAGDTVYITGTKSQSMKTLSCRFFGELTVAD